MMPDSTERTDFSLVLGGPLFQLFRSAHLTGDALEMSRRRVIVIACIAWVPLLLLALMAGRRPGDVAIPFIYDVEVHVRFLVALPILIAAELIVHRRLLPAVRQFVQRRIVIPEELPRFEQAIEATMRLRNSVVIEVALIGIVYTMGIWLWRNQIAVAEPSWYALPSNSGVRLTPAGYWLMLISTPLFQFILLRWYFRFFLWFSFLFRVARLNLHLIPIHPDRAGGLGFLGASPMAFAPVLIAQGAVLAGLIATRIFFEGQELTDFKVQIVGFVAFFVLATLIPLMVFVPLLAAARRAGLGDAGRLASRYGRQFEEKWFRGGASDEQLLGSGDIQSLADLGNSMGVVQEMRMVPFGWRDVTRLVMITTVPFVPLLFTVFSLEDFASYLIKAIF